VPNNNQGANATNRRMRSADLHLWMMDDSRITGRLDPPPQFCRLDGNQTSMQEACEQG
jgi:hypothetical protein